MLRNLQEIPGYEGLYSITRRGRVWSHRLGREIFPFIDKSSTRYYYRIGLTDKDRKVKKWYHHRLVAITYLPKRRSKLPLEINHKDFNTLNNDVKNLEWATRSENILHSVPRRRQLKYKTIYKNTLEKKRKELQAKLKGNRAVKR